MKKRVFNRIRTDLLEYKMSSYLFLGKFEEYESVKDIAIEIDAPVDTLMVIRKAIDLRISMDNHEYSDLIYLLNVEKGLVK